MLINFHFKIANVLRGTKNKTKKNIHLKKKKKIVRAKSTEPVNTDFDRKKQNGV